MKDKKLFLKTPIKVPKRIKCESEKGVEWSRVECVTAIVYSVSVLPGVSSPGSADSQPVSTSQHINTKEISKN